MRKAFAYLLLIIFLASPSLVEAQCAMCKAVVESNAQGGDNIVEGVNNAILYLMGVPYFLVIGLAYFWHKKYFKAEGEAE